MANYQDMDLGADGLKKANSTPSGSHSGSPPGSGSTATKWIRSKALQVEKESTTLKPGGGIKPAGL